MKRERKIDVKLRFATIDTGTSHSQFMKMNLPKLDRPTECSTHDRRDSAIQERSKKFP
jgi:hypothetical protein